MTLWLLLIKIRLQQGRWTLENILNLLRRTGKAGIITFVDTSFYTAIRIWQQHRCWVLTGSTKVFRLIPQQHPTRDMNILQHKEEKNPAWRIFQPGNFNAFFSISPAQVIVVSIPDALFCLKRFVARGFDEYRWMADGEGVWLLADCLVTSPGWLCGAWWCRSRVVSNLFCGTDRFNVRK